MQRYQVQGGRLRAFFASRAVMAALFLIVLGVGVAAARALVGSSVARKEREQAEERLQGLTLKKETLQKEVQDFTTGHGVEREARDKLNLRKPGEEVVIILDPANGAASATVEAEGQGMFWRLLHRVRTFIGMGN